MGTRNCHCFPYTHREYEILHNNFTSVHRSRSFAKPGRGGDSHSEVKLCRELAKIYKQSANHMSDNQKIQWTGCKARLQEKFQKYKECKAEQDEAKRDEMGCPKGKRPKGMGGKLKRMMKKNKSG